MKNIAFIISLQLIFLLLCSEASCIPREYIGEFVLINNGEELIALAKVEICDQSFEIKNIGSREKHIGKFKITKDSHYNISIIFASGKKLRKQIGYVTPGFEFQHTIGITEASITIEDTQVRE